ncbi:MAG: hypothetical protein Q9160_002891 [Pyrenula sp. 1 TL-2023]
MRGMPHLAFKHLRGASYEVNLPYLVDIWTYSFRSARASFRKLSLRQGSVYIELNRPELDNPIEHHKALLNGFSPNIYPLCGPAMQQFVPVDPRNPEWDPGRLMERLQLPKSSDKLQKANDAVTNNCYVLVSILLGMVYGLCSKVCLENDATLDESSEIVFSPDIIFEGGTRIKRWAKDIGLAMLSNGGFTWDHWSFLIFELFLGSPWQKDNPNKYTTGQMPLGETYVLGAQANGMTAVADILVRTTIGPQARVQFHVRRGQILNLPLTSEGYIQASHHLGQATRFRPEPQPGTGLLHRFEPSIPEETLRIDVEPCWEADPCTVVFRVRDMGRLVAALNIKVILDMLSWSIIDCHCPKALDAVTVPIADRWQHVSINQLMQTASNGMSRKRADLNVSGEKFLIDASRSDSATLFALGIVRARSLGIAKDCMECARRWGSNNEKLFSGVTILIASSELEETGDSFLPKLNIGS